MRDKSIINAKKKLLIKMTAEFCSEHIDDEYSRLCKKLIEKMARKRTVPFLSGRIENWASAIIYTIGSINFLQDKAFQPYCPTEFICKFFGVSIGTTRQKAANMRNMFKMSYYDSEFSTERLLKDNPLSKLTMINGFIVPIQDSHLKSVPFPDNE